MKIFKLLIFDLILFYDLKVGNLFIISLAFADLIVGCFVMPVAGIYVVMNKWTFCMLTLSALL